jgi:PAT family beta-lactamase induction signal transducer AmpG
MSEAERPYQHPLSWVPSSYFAMGTVWVTVTTMSNVMLLNLGLSVAQAAFYSSLLGLPYIFKPLWAPLLELYGTKKSWVVSAQVVLAGLLLATAFALPLPSFVAPVFTLLMLTGIVGATMDIGSDGVYVTTLPAKEQAKYTGIQSMCWSFGPIMATGGLVWVTGKLHERMSFPWAWLSVFIALAVLLGLAALLHSRALPAGAKAADAPASFAEAMKTFGVAFALFFKKPSIWAMITFAFLYRFGLGLLDKIGPAFLIDSRLAGGIGLDNSELGVLNGTVGSAAFIIGSVLGGLFVSRSRRGLIGVLFVLALCLNLPNLTFLYLGLTTPSNAALGGQTLIGVLVFIEKFGWGFGAVGHMLYMMQQIAPGPYKTAHYAFATGFMGLCMTTSGMLSGWIAENVGYPSFFFIVLVAAAPSLLATLHAPFIHAEGDPAHDGKKRFVLEGGRAKLALGLVLAVTAVAAVFAWQRASSYQAERAALTADTSACFDQGHREACFFQCKNGGNAAACQQLSTLFQEQAPQLGRSRLEALAPDAIARHKYQRREAWAWHQRALSLRCGSPPEAEAPWYQFWKYWFEKRPTPPARSESARQACQDLGLVLLPANNAGEVKSDDPCAPDLELTEQRRAWCDVVAPDADAAKGWFTKACDHGRGTAQACAYAGGRYR